jgi:hypothetical protein
VVHFDVDGAEMDRLTPVMTNGRHMPESFINTSVISRTPGRRQCLLLPAAEHETTLAAELRLDRTYSASISVGSHASKGYHDVSLGS